MAKLPFEVESSTPFAESLIWQLNRNFYQEKGISAWSDGIVPHHMTSNSFVGKTYAELIFATLQDLAKKDAKGQVVYILELGAGHGRLAFHILKHLQKLVTGFDGQLPDYCYVLSDIVEENLAFFNHHPQLQNYFRDGTLDIAYYDALAGEKLYLRKSKQTIQPGDLDYPLLAIGNYFFDSIPSALYFIQNQVISECSISIQSQEDPQGKSAASLIDQMQLTYHHATSKPPAYEEAILNEILEDYRQLEADTYLFFPKQSMDCLSRLKGFSKAGLILLTMDKGFHELDSLKKKKEPDVVTHGSFSLWVNYHALSEYCLKHGGKVLFPAFSNFHLEIGCLFFTKEGDQYAQTAATYNRVVNDFGPDDFNSIKQLAYFNVSRLKLNELIAIYRLSAYDSTIFVKLSSRLKQVLQQMTFSERKRVGQTLDAVWDLYFNINEKIDLAYEIGGLYYDLGYYTKALVNFQYSIDQLGLKADVLYNQALCYYQLRQDQLFFSTLQIAKNTFPESEAIRSLEQLDMG